MTGRNRPHDTLLREAQVLTMLAEGASIKEMAATLYMSLDTVRDYRKRIYRDLGARNAPHAVAIAYQEGLLGRDGKSSTKAAA